MVLKSLIREVSAIWRAIVIWGYCLEDVIFIDFGCGGMKLFQHLAFGFPGSDIIGIDIDKVLRNLFPYNEFEKIRNELDIEAEKASGVSTKTRQCRSHFNRGLGVYGAKVESNLIYCKSYKDFEDQLWLDPNKVVFIVAFIDGVPKPVIKELLRLSCEQNSKVIGISIGDKCRAREGKTWANFDYLKNQCAAFFKKPQVIDSFSVKMSGSNEGKKKLIVKIGTKLHEYLDCNKNNIMKMLLTQKFQTKRGERNYNMYEVVAEEAHLLKSCRGIKFKYSKITKIKRRRGKTGRTVLTWDQIKCILCREIRRTKPTLRYYNSISDETIKDIVWNGVVRSNVEILSDHIKNIEEYTEDPILDVGKQPQIQGNLNKKGITDWFNSTFEYARVAKTASEWELRKKIKTKNVLGVPTLQNIVDYLYSKSLGRTSNMVNILMKVIGGYMGIDAPGKRYRSRCVHSSHYVYWHSGFEARAKIKEAITDALQKCCEVYGTRIPKLKEFFTNPTHLNNHTKAKLTAFRDQIFERILHITGIDVSTADQSVIKNMSEALFGTGNIKSEKKKASKIMAEAIKRHSPSAKVVALAMAKEVAKKTEI
eukprot:g7239.t1